MIFNKERYPTEIHGLKELSYMISALHLIWIIPLSASFGFLVAACMSAAKH